MVRVRTEIERQMNWNQIGGEFDVTPLLQLLPMVQGKNLRNIELGRQSCDIQHQCKVL